MANRRYTSEEAYTFLSMTDSEEEVTHLSDSGSEYGPVDDSGSMTDRSDDRVVVPAKLKISSLYIQSTIVSRYAHTKVQTVMVNPHAESKEAIFELELPSSAFISNFTLYWCGKKLIDLCRTSTASLPVWLRHNTADCGAALRMHGFTAAIPCMRRLSF
ncbi:hypothetical protein AB205_0114280 [Aquarana catesbeiana]|uniref:VIT domain-containing protein n=1 Tax=Aquarana catesbeiana TaxID=8400 RepID=A0A2G9SG78_AQUCT|nr:hypothetical protein AB205_0114280 [Aquarana catesbeiana]